MHRFYSTTRNCVFVYSLSFLLNYYTTGALVMTKNLYHDADKIQKNNMILIVCCCIMFIHNVLIFYSSETLFWNLIFPISCLRLQITSWLVLLYGMIQVLWRSSSCFPSLQLCFSRQFWSSINRADYMALRLGFITVSLPFWLKKIV